MSVPHSDPTVNGSDALSVERVKSSTSTQSRSAQNKEQNRRQEVKGKAKTQKLSANEYLTARDALAELERRHGPLSGLWTYQNIAGEPIGVVVRRDRPDGSKDFRSVARKGKSWRISGVVTPNPLYGLPNLVRTNRVYVCEGEKAAESALSLGVAATTSPYGPTAARSADWTPLAGKEVVLLPDNDASGQKYAEDVAKILVKLTPRPVVHIVELPELPEKGDVVDWIAANSNVSPDALRTKLDGLVDASIPVCAASQPAVERFRPFPVESLPEPLRKFVAAGAAAIGCDPSYIALPVLSACGAAVGNSRRLQLKRGWWEPPIVWAAIIGESGTQKSPALSLVLRPLLDRQIRALEQHAKEMEDYERARLNHERALSIWKHGKGCDPPEAPAPPTAPRFIVRDTTVEALAPLLRDNGRGLLLARDELNGWLGSFDRYSKGGKGGGDSANWLSMFSADAVVVDRKTAPPIIVPNAAICVTGGIQPTVLHRALGVEHRESGLAARLLVSSPPRRPKRWTEAEISEEVEQSFADLLDRLFALQPKVDGDDRLTPRQVRLSAGAKRMWVNFCNAHGEEAVNLTGDLAAAWSKFEAYAARIALVLHCVEEGANCLVASSTMKASLTLVAWLKHETRRVYAMLGEDDAGRELRRRAEWIEKKGGIISAREYQRGRRNCRTAAEADKDLEALAAAGYGSWEFDDHDGGPGRPSRRFVLAGPPVNGMGNYLDGQVNSVDVDTLGSGGELVDDEWGEVP